jgi:effector-binding domain-containing protein
MSYEKLAYQVISSDGPIEIRAYEPFMMMKVESRLNAGFGTLFNYIAGDNEKKEKIAMTVPVLTDLSSDGYIAFTMPKEKMDNYPKANNEKIEFIEMKDKTFLAYPFRGHHHHAKDYFEKLKAYAEEKKIHISKEPILLRYESPFSLPFLRHNDVIVEILKD